MSARANRSRQSALRLAVAALLLLLASPVAGEYTKITPRKARGARDLVLAAGGDVAYPAGKYDRFLEREGPRLLAPIRSYLDRADLVFVNLEAPLTTAPVVGSKTYQFTMPPERLDWLIAQGVNLFSVANNHIEDAGLPGLRDTIEVLERAARKRGIHWAGAALGKRSAASPVYFQPRGKKLKVAFLAFTYRGSDRVATPRGGALLTAVREARRRADVVIVSLHYGLEYRHVPRAAKRKLFRAVADAGAQIVLGHHPHVLQGVERRGDSIIFYSLGNLSFASKTQRHHETGARMYGMLPLVEIKDGKLRRVEIVPLYVDNLSSWTLGDAVQPRSRFEPAVLTQPFADEVLRALQGWSAEIEGNDTTIHLRGGRGIVRFD